MIKKLILRAAVIMLGSFLLTACKEDTDISLSSDTSSSSLEQKESLLEGNSEADKIVVYVNGAVKYPGVYTLKMGDRVYQAIDMAGGMTARAEKDAMNLAETVVDAQNIYVMTKKEYKKHHAENADMTEKDTNEVLVNINTADKDSLTTLPGVGEAKAAAIIAYREENGLFSSKEELKKVSGIGDATYANIEDLITIK